MLASIEQLYNLVIGVTLFGLVLCVWVGALLVWHRRRTRREDQLRSRLDMLEGGDSQTRVLRLWHDGQEATTTVPGRTGKRTFQRRLNNFFRDAGIKTAPGAFIAIIAGATLFSALLMLLFFHNLIIAMGVAMSVVIIVWIALRGRVDKNATLYRRQLVEAMDLAARSLKAGHPLGVAFKLISQEIGAPIGPIFAEVYQEQTMGVSLEEAVRQLGEASSSDEMKLFATSVVVQLRSGGNLADLMNRLCHVIRERTRQARRFRVLTAQTQFSKRVLLAWPMLLFVILNIINPVYMEPLYSSSAGHKLMAVTVGLFLVGVVVMNRMSTLRQ